MSKRYRPPTIAERFTQLRAAEITLREKLELFEARRPAYQEGFIPTYVTNAQRAYDDAKAAYNAAVAEADAAREDGSR